MSRKKRTPFAVSKDGKLYVAVGAVMHPLVPLIDGLPVTFFGKEKHGYLDIDTAIDWCRKEPKEKELRALEDAKKKFAEGKIQDANKS